VAVGRVSEGVVALWKDPFRLALMALVIDNTSHVTSYYTPLALMRPGLILFCLSVLFALASRSKIDHTVLRLWIPRLVILQGVIVCGSAVFGISLGFAGRSIIDSYSKTFIVALLLMMGIRGIADVRRTMWAQAAGGVILAFLAIFVVHLTKEVGAITWDPNDVGLIMVLCLPFLFLMAQTSNGFGKIFAIVGSGLAVTTIVLSGSRGAFLGTATVGVALLVFLPGVSVARRVAIVGAIGIGMIAFAPGTYWQSMHKMTQRNRDYNWDASSGRRELAKRGFEYMMTHPVFGIGMNNFSMAEGTISPLARRYANTRVGIKWSAPHNAWVQAGAETGIPGLVVFATLMIGSAVSVIKIRRRLPKAWLKNGTSDQRFLYLASLYVPVAFAGFLMCATFLSWAWNDPVYVLLAIALGLRRSIIAALPSPAAQSRPVPRPLRGGQRHGTRAVAG
jgi:O-antigen ligase